MAAASGQYGQINADGSTLQECTEWVMTKETATHAYASCSTNGWRKRVAGTKGATGSCGLLVKNRSEYCCCLLLAED